MKRIATGIAFAFMLAPLLARAEDKSTTTPSSSSQQATPATKDTQKTAGNPMNTPDTEKKSATASSSSTTTDKSSSSSASASDEKMTDARLVTLMQKVNKEEIEAGKLAEKRGKSAEVRKFGKMLITDHTKSQKEVAAAAKKAKVSPSDSALTTKDKEQEKTDKNKMDQLKKLNGAEFDKAFAQELSNDHEHMISLLKDHKDDLKSDDLKTLVDDTIPVLQQHKDMADKAMSQESASAGSNQGRAAPGLSRSPASSETSPSKTGDDSSKSGATDTSSDSQKK